MLETQQSNESGSVPVRNLGQKSGSGVFVISKKWFGCFCHFKKVVRVVLHFKAKKFANNNFETIDMDGWIWISISIWIWIWNIGYGYDMIFFFDMI